MTYVVLSFIAAAYVVYRLDIIVNRMNRATNQCYRFAVLAMLAGATAMVVLLLGGLKPTWYETCILVGVALFLYADRRHLEERLPHAG